MRLVVINTDDKNAMKQALSLDADLMLIQNGVYFLNRANGPDLGDKKVYALDTDISKRGLTSRLVDGVEIIDYEGMVDLLFSGVTVVNL